MRYVLAVLSTGMLHVAYLAIVFAADLHSPYAVIPAGRVVAIPLLVGAYIESRHK